MINPISNGEIGSSVRTKLNATITAVQATKIKTADTSRTSSTLADDPDLSITLPSSELVIVQFHLVWQLDATSAIVMNWDVTTPSVGPFITYRHTVNLANPGLSYLTSFTNYTPVAAPGYHLVDGSIALTSSGNITLRWANNSGAGTLTLLAGSWIRVVRSS